MTSSTKRANQLLSNSQYDFLKKTTTVVLPGLGALYFALATIWGLPAAEQVVGTIAAVNVFLGVLVNLGTKSYDANEERFAGAIDIQDNGLGKKTYSLNLNGDPEELDGMETVTFRINRP